MINLALALYARPVRADDVMAAMARYGGPFSAGSAFKGDEAIGARDWPWIVVGASGVNVFGRLWDKDYAIGIAQLMNEAWGA